MINQLFKDQFVLERLFLLFQQGIQHIANQTLLHGYSLVDMELLAIFLCPPVCSERRCFILTLIEGNRSRKGCPLNLKHLCKCYG